MIGEVLNDRYKIKKELGKGGMAIVYEARDLLLDRLVAIKMLREEYASKKDFIKKFRHEAKAVAKISHPNVVNIYDIAKDNGYQYLVMENIKGENLKDIIQKRETLSIAEALDIAGQICSALVVAHKNNIIHCDIKPHNILIDNNKQVKVTDFGIAKAVSDSTLKITDTIIGSAHYFSPEQAKGEDIKAHSDIYSVGVVLYEMLTGEVPFNGNSPVSVALKHIKEKAQAPLNLNPVIPEKVNALIMKALDKNPENRFDSAREMREEIITVLKNLNQNKANSNKQKFNKGDTKIISKSDIIDNNQHKEKNKYHNQKKKKEKRKKSLLKNLSFNPAIGLGIIIILILLTFIGIFYYVRIYTDPPIVAAPELEGLDLMQAQEMAQQEGLNLQIQNEVFHSEYEQNSIISQVPSGNRMIRKTRPIEVIVSKGPESLKVPDLSGMSLRKAQVELENNNIKIGELTREYHENVSKDYIIEQIPEPETEIPVTDKIDLIVSRGPRPDMITMPELMGMEKEEALERLIEYNLEAGEITEKDSFRYKNNQIAAQQYDVNEEIPKGSEVDLVVSKGLINPDNLKVHTRIIRLPVKGFNEQRVQIIVIDDNGEDLFYDRVHRPDENVAVTVKSVGATTYKIYLDEKIYFEAGYDEQGNKDFEERHM